MPTTQCIFRLITHSHTSSRCSGRRSGRSEGSCIMFVRLFVTGWLSNSLRAWGCWVGTLWGRDFPDPSRPVWGPPNLFNNEYRIPSSRLKHPGHGADHPSPSSGEDRVCVCYTPTFPLWLLGTGWICIDLFMGWVTQSVQRLSKGCKVRGSYPCGGRYFPHPSWPALGPTLYNGYLVFPGDKAVGAWRWLPTPSISEVKERVELYLYSPSGSFVSCYWVTFTFTFIYLFIYLRYMSVAQTIHQVAKRLLECNAT